MRSIGVVIALFFISINTNAKVAKKKQNPPKTHSQKFFFDETTSEEIKNSDLVKAIRGYGALIKSESNVSKKINFCIAQNSSYMGLIKNIRKFGYIEKTDKKNEEVSLKMVLQNSQFVLNSKEASANDRAKAAYQSGVVYSYSGNSAKSSEMFLLSIKEWPASPWAPTVNIYVAEYFFDTEQYKKSIDQFLLYFKSYAVVQKSLALYKVAWAYHNLEKFIDAEKYLLSIINVGSSLSFYEDSIRDLAYFTTLHRDENNIILFSRTHFEKNLNLRMDFLIHVFKYFYQQSTTSIRLALYDEILTHEKRIEKKLDVLLLSLRSQQREYASYNVVKELKKIEEQIEINKIEFKDEKFSTFFKEFEPELLLIIKSYIETYTGKTKSPENIPRDYLTAETIKVISMHLKYYPHSLEKEKTYSIWLDLCQEQKSIECKYQVSKKILADPAVVALHERAYAELVLAIDQMRFKKKGAAQDVIDQATNELVLLLEGYCNNVEKESRGEWIIYTKKLTALYTEKKMFEKALPLLIKIDAKEKTSESLYRLLYVKYELAQFEDIIKNQVAISEDVYGKNTHKIIEDSYLKLANQALLDNQFNIYQNYIEAFIKMSGDKSKIESAKIDLIQRFIEKNDFNKAYELLSLIPPKKRFFDKYKNASLQTLNYLFSTGDFVKARAYFEAVTELKNIPDFEVYYLLSKAAIGEDYTEKEIAYLLNKNNNISKAIFNYLSVLQPKKIIDMLDSIKLIEIHHKKYLLTAIQFFQKTNDPQLTARQELNLSDILPSYMKNKKVSPFEIQLEKVSFPDYKIKSELLNRKTQETLQKVRTLRRQVIKEIKDKPAKVQVRILTKSKNLEFLAVQFLDNMPIPEGASIEEVTEFKNGIAEIAKEFSQQADEFQKMTLAIETSLSNQLINNYDFDRVEKLPVLTEDIKETVKANVSVSNYLKALLALDFWNARNDKKMRNDYYALKFFILIKYQNTDLVKFLILNEINEERLDEIKNYLIKDIK